MTQAELADAVGVDQPTVSKWVKGSRRPSLEELSRIERACRVPLGFVLRAAGFVADTLTVPDAIEADPMLPEPDKQLLLLIYNQRVAVAR